MAHTLKEGGQPYSAVKNGVAEWPKHACVVDELGPVPNYYDREVCQWHLREEGLTFDILNKITGSLKSHATRCSDVKAFPWVSGEVLQLHVECVGLLLVVVAEGH